MIDAETAQQLSEDLRRRIRANVQGAFSRELHYRPACEVREGAHLWYPDGPDIDRHSGYLMPMTRVATREEAEWLCALLDMAYRRGRSDQQQDAQNAFKTIFGKELAR